MNELQEAKIYDYLKLIYLASIWSGSFICIEIALNSYSFLFVSFARIFLASLFFLPFIYFKKLTFPRDKKVWKILIFAGILNNAIPFSLLAWGQQYINASTAAIVLAVGPFIALVLSHFTTHDEKFTIYKFLGVILGFLGILILLINEFSNNNLNAFYGQIAVLFASAGYILSGLLLRKIPQVSSIVTSTSMFITASICLFPFVLYYVPLSSYDYMNNSFYALIFLAIIPTAYASIIRIKILQSVGVQFMSQVTYLIPIFTIFFSALFFNEKPKLITYVALLLVFLGLFIRRIKSKKQGLIKKS